MVYKISCGEPLHKVDRQTDRVRECVWNHTQKRGERETERVEKIHRQERERASERARAYVHGQPLLQISGSS